MAKSAAVRSEIRHYRANPVRRRLKIADQRTCEISVVAPIYGEEENIGPFLDALLPVLRGLERDFEIIAVNDGSRDASLERLRSASANIPELRIINFRRNYGQTAAIMAGIDYALGQIIVPIDADLQNDPKDIPALLAKLDEGYDLVSGWRQDRKDHAVRRNLVSRMANVIISRVSGVHLNDYGCTLKAYRSEVLKDVRLYGEMHRFIPIYASWMGARTAEIPVQHHPRRFGRSKYGLERIVKVVLDLMVVKFLDRHLVKPIYIFGGFGLFTLGLSFLSGSLMLYLKVFKGVSMILTPLPLLTALTFLVGFMSLLMGLLAEILVRTYFESQDRRAYAIRELINFPQQN
jgi:glycosyltransferase involved in cell wall biosynthesis